jgi:hypothetical protein
VRQDALGPVSRAADALARCVRAIVSPGTFVRFAMEVPMTFLKPEHSSAYGPDFHALARHLERSALIVATLAAGLLLVWFVPPPLVLPVVGIVSFTVAVVIALFAYYSGADRHAHGMTPWDVAGAFALIWVAAGILSKPEHLVQMFGHMTMAP